MQVLGAYFEISKRKYNITLSLSLLLYFYGSFKWVKLMKIAIFMRFTYQNGPDEHSENESEHYFFFDISK